MNTEIIDQFYIKNKICSMPYTGLDYFYLYNEVFYSQAGNSTSDDISYTKKVFCKLLNWVLAFEKT